MDSLSINEALFTQMLHQDDTVIEILSIESTLLELSSNSAESSGTFYGEATIQSPLSNPWLLGGWFVNQKEVVWAF
jgi:hypothetical protein